MRGFARWMAHARWLPYVLLAALALAFTAAHAGEVKAFSPADEYVYYDYLTKVPRELFVHTGEEVGPQARNELSCRGVLNYGKFGEACNRGSHDDDRAYPYNGGTGADIYAPPYFAVTWALSRPMVWAGMNELDAGRLLGGAWLAAGLALVFGLLRSMRIRAHVAFGAAAALLALPSLYWSTQFLSTDAPTLAVTAAIGWCGVGVARRTAPVWALPVAAVVGVLFKVQNLAAVGIVALTLAIVAVERERRAAGRLRLISRETVVAVVSVVAGVGAQAVWLVVRRLAAASSQPSIDTTGGPLTIRGLVDEAFKFIRGVGDAGLGMNTWTTAWTSLFGVLAVSAVAVAVLEPARLIRWSVGTSTGVVALLMGPALALATTLLVGHYVPLPVRYGVVLLAPVTLCIAWMLDRGPRIGWATFAAGTIVGAASIVLV